MKEVVPLGERSSRLDNVFTISSPRPHCAEPLHLACSAVFCAEQSGCTVKTGVKGIEGLLHSKIDMGRGVMENVKLKTHF